MLEKDWDRKIKLAMLASKRGDRPFHEWAYEMQTRNALLRGRLYHFEDDTLRETLENNMDQGLELRIRRLAIAATVPLRDWIETVKAEDEFVSRERKEAKEMAREMYRMERAEYRVERTGMKNITNSGRSFGTDSNVGRTVGTRAVGNSVTRPTGSAALPKLTPAERSIIFDHQGCFKCRRLYVNHKGANCQNGFPSGSSYKPLTTEYAEVVRDSKNKPRSRVPGPVAHIGYSGSENATAGGSAVLGVGDEESDDSDKYVQTHNTPTPFSSGHLEWRCRVDGPAVSEPIMVTALIDNGSHTVLIDEELVEKLGLRRRRMAHPQRVRLAMGEGEVVFLEWVKLQTDSTDQEWTARTVRAIVAPKLAYPVILGGPFLKSNKIVIDHEFGKVTAKDTHYQLIPQIPRVMDRPKDVGAAADHEEGKTRQELLAKLQEHLTRPGLFKELRERTKDRKVNADCRSTIETSHEHFAKTLDNRIQVLAVWDELERHD